MRELSAVGSIGSLALAAFATVIGCSSGATDSEASRTEQARATSQAIQGGTVDTDDTYTVGLCVGKQTSNGQTFCQYTCSGALIAPNLIVTARHCVQQASETIDCTTSKFGSSLGQVYVTTDTVIQSATHWFPVKAGGVITPAPTPFCGNDIALLILNANVPAAMATPITPVGQYKMTDHTRYSFYEDAIGYGITAVGSNDSGTRRMKKDVAIKCIPGDKKRDCGDLTGTGITANEFLTGDATCSGDSGSSAIEHDSHFSNAPVSLGVLSRGGQDGTICKEGIYTRLDAWRDLIVSTVKTAAPLGGYTVPAWTAPAPPEPVDAGAPVKDGGATTKPNGTTAAGDTCTKNEECASKTCVSPGDDTFVCADGCDPSAGSAACADGFHCIADGNSGFCFAGAPPTAANNATSTTTSGCSISHDPTKPVPWRSLGVVAIVGLAFAGRRRRTR